jgi:hypothetical protein
VGTASIGLAACPVLANTRSGPGRTHPRVAGASRTLLEPFHHALDPYPAAGCGWDAAPVERHRDAVPRLFATASRVGTAREQIETATESCGHLSLFLGAGTIRNSWPRVARWLGEDR